MKSMMRSVKQSKAAFAIHAKKEVIDFTTWSEDRLKAYFKNERTGCGRFRHNQLKTYEFSQEVRGNSQWMTMALTFFVILFSSRPTTAQVKASQAVEISDSIFRGSQKKIRTKPIDQVRISGVVTNADGLPISDVKVRVIGTNREVITNIEGRYSILVEPSKRDSVEFYFGGYNVKTITFSSSDISDIIRLSHVQLLKDIDLTNANLNQVLGGYVGGYVITEKNSPRNDQWILELLFR